MPVFEVCKGLVVVIRGVWLDIPIVKNLDLDSKLRWYLLLIGGLVIFGKWELNHDLGSM